MAAQKAAEGAAECGSPEGSIDGLNETEDDIDPLVDLFDV